MGLLERLRAEREAREREARRQSQVAESLFNQQQESKRQTEAFHQNQRMRAEQTLKESGIGSLVSELSELVNGGGVFLYGQSEKPEERHISIRDVDSYIAVFHWDVQKRKIGQKSEYGNYYTYYDCSERYFVIEVCPDGVIKISASGSGNATINSNQWRSNSSLLEATLERAFNNPLVHRYRDTETLYNMGR